MRHATLRQLAIFSAVADRMSFSRAADDLHLTQPAISAQIKALEGHAGLPLCERTGRTRHLTAAGHAL
jgi:DNA-binding transcriptional LysR family regulator